MKNRTVFVACDTSNLNEIKKIIDQTNSKKLKIIPKFGLQFFYSKNGRKFLEKFKKDFWLDLKINDIPQTALSAIESLKDLKDTKQKFDFVFIDADKENNKNYYNKSLDLIDKNGLIIIDNVLWHGEVIDITKNDKLTVGIREFNSYVHNDRRVENLIIPVGDGLTICRKL